MIFNIYMKSMLKRLPLFLLIPLAQILCGQISADALSERNAEFCIAIVMQTDSALAHRYAEALLAGGLELKKVTEPSEAYKDFRVQGCLTIPADFDKRLEEGKRDILLFEDAPGVSDTSGVRESIIDALLPLRAEMMLQDALSESGLEFDGEMEDYSVPILVEYTGPKGENIPFANAPPPYGVPALFLLLAFLHAHTVCLGHLNRRKLYEKNSQMTAYFSIFLSVAIFWGLLICLFFFGNSVMRHIPINFFMAAVFMLIMLYAAALGCVFSAFVKHSAALWFFITWFFLNLTIGGGIWNVTVLPLWLRVILPIGFTV